MFLYLDHTAWSIFLPCCHVPGPEGHGKKPVAYKWICEAILTEKSSSLGSPQFSCPGVCPLLSFWISINFLQSPLTFYQVFGYQWGHPHSCYTVQFLEDRRGLPLSFHCPVLPQVSFSRCEGCFMERVNVYNLYTVVISGCRFCSLSYFRNSMERTSILVQGDQERFHWGSEAQRLIL